MSCSCLTERMRVATTKKHTEASKYGTENEYTFVVCLPLSNPKRISNTKKPHNKEARKVGHYEDKVGTLLPEMMFFEIPGFLLLKDFAKVC